MSTPTIRIEGPVLDEALYRPEFVTSVLAELPAELTVEARAVPGGTRLILVADEEAAGRRALFDVLNHILEVSLQCKLEQA